MKATNFCEWYNPFQDGREDVEDGKLPGRPNTPETNENVKKWQKLL